MAPSRISELSSLIAVRTAEVDAYLTSQALPTPSFDAHAPPYALLDDRIAAARQAILEATDELNALMLGPIGLLTSPSHNFLVSLQAICRFNLATSFPDDKDETTFADVATVSGVDESHVRRLLRHAMTYRIFCEPRKGVVAHTAASKLLAEDMLMREWIGMVSEEMWPAAVKTVDAIATWPDSEEPNHSGFNIAHNTDSSLFEELAKHPGREKRYANAMSWFSTRPGLQPVHILESFPWGSLGTGLVVDVGGSHGAVSVAIARKFPSLRCIVQDRLEVVQVGQAMLDADLHDQVTFMEHDFFTEQPVKNADVYYFRWILHDWSDGYAVRILRALIPALKNKAQIVISDIVLPEPGRAPVYQERAYRAFDLAMWEFHNAKERDFEDWIKLFRDADPRFEFQSARRPSGSLLGIIEAVWIP